MELKLINVNNRGNITPLTFPELDLLEIEVKRVFEKEHLNNLEEYDYWGAITLSYLFDYNLWTADIGNDTKEMGHFCTLYLVKDNEEVDYSCSLSFLIRFS